MPHAQLDNKSLGRMYVAEQQKNRRVRERERESGRGGLGLHRENNQQSVSHSDQVMKVRHG